MGPPDKCFQTRQLKRCVRLLVQQHNMHHIQEKVNLAEPVGLIADQYYQHPNSTQHLHMSAHLRDRCKVIQSRFPKYVVLLQAKQYQQVPITRQTDLEIYCLQRYVSFTNLISQHQGLSIL